MKKLFTFLCISCMLYSCSESTIFDDNEDGNAIYDAPYVRSYTTYTSQNSVTLNGFIDQENVFFRESDTYKVGFIFRTGDAQDSSNDRIIELEGDVEYYTGTYKFNYDIDGLEPNTTYHYTAHTKNGPTEDTDWKSFTTSAIPCTYEQDNYYSISGGTWKSATVQITDPNCCDEGNVGFRFGTWPDIFEIAFNELSNGYPKTGQYFGVDSRFDLTHIQRELVKSTNQVLIEYNSNLETELFVNNDGERITITFCNTILKGGDILNGKVSVAIPSN